MYLFFIMLTLSGVVVDIDEQDRIKLKYLPKYNYNWPDSYNTMICLATESKKHSGYTPANNQWYRVKVPPNIAMYDFHGENITLANLINHPIVIEAEPIGYNINGKTGWYLKAFSIKTLDANKIRLI